jgi:hypothetical protein
VPDEVKDVSHRPQILSSLQNLAHHVPDDGSWSTSAATISLLSDLPSSPFSQPEHNFNFLPFESLHASDYFPHMQESTVAYPELFHDSMESTTFEYPLTNPVPMSGTHRHYSQINPVPSHMFSEQTQPRFTPLFHPSNTTADVSFYLSPNSSNFLTGSLGEPAPPAVAGIGSNAFSVTAINHLPWNVPPLQPKTNIHGGTFIGGNVNHIQHHGEPGECQS